MSDITDCTSLSKNGPDQVVLPTRQRNALRLLLEKPSFSPQEIAALDRRVIERAPGIGRKSIELIDTWLKSHGYALQGTSNPVAGRRQERKRRKLQQAIDLLRVHGYEIRRPG